MIITADSIGKRFNRHWIFRDFSCTFDTGNIYAITGPNGSGKSTLMQILWGQLPSTTGKISYKLGGNEIPAEDFSKHISIAAPYMELIEEFTLAEHIQFHYKLRKPRTELSIEDIISKMYLSDASDKQVMNFSSGMKQRLKLGLAMLTQADVLFLDEPGTNLDDQALNWYHEILAEVASESLIFIATNQQEDYPESAKTINLKDIKG